MGGCRDNVLKLCGVKNVLLAFQIRQIDVQSVTRNGGPGSFA